VRTISLITAAVPSFRQSFISTGAGAFFFEATGAAVSSDGCGADEVVGSDGSFFGGADEVVSSDGFLLVGMDEVVSSEGSLFDGIGAAVGFDGSVFGATGTDVRVGRGRGKGVSNRTGSEASRCLLPSVPVTRVNQLETSCAISDRGDRASVRAGDGACAFTDAAPSVTRNKECVAAFRIRTFTVSVHSAPNQVTRLTGISAVPRTLFASADEVIE
jgi:hypothetical protein